MKKLLFVFVCSCFLLSLGWTKTSTKKVQNLNEVNRPNYENYVPHNGENLPVIEIYSESQNNKFVTKPIASNIKKIMQSWGPAPSNPSPYYENCKISITDDDGSIFMKNTQAQVKVRGNWTSTYDKKSLRVKFQKKQGMLGLHNGEEFKNWVLIAMYKDWSMLRDYTAQYMSKLISPYYSSDSRLVEVYINDVYWGVYLLAELQEVSKNRINITKPRKGYKGTDIGYLLESDTYAKYEEKSKNFVLDYKLPIYDIDGNKASKGLLIKTFTIKNDINDMEQHDFIKKYMTLLWELCYEASYNNKFYKFNKDYTELVPSDAKDCFECVSSVIDIDSLIDTYILSEICCDADLYWTSFYMDVDFGKKGNKKLTFEAPWDFDSALGNKDFCSDGKGLYAAKIGWDTDKKHKGTCNPWMIVFVRCDWFQKLVREKWKSVHDNDVLGKVLENIDFVTTQYRACFGRNQNKWKNIGEAWRFGTELSKESAACTTQAQASAFFAEWLQRRFSGLDELWLE
ncbi:MAG: CotH kinase family protein [Treponema sp.]|nr:CotH kinase family protein [Treponema sp.]